MNKEINDNQNMPDDDSLRGQQSNDNQITPNNDNQNIPNNDSSNPYQTIIEQQQAQIDALIAQTTALNSQIINMVNAGAQFNDGNNQVSFIKPMQTTKVTDTTQPIALSDDTDYSLESLAKEIGRKHG